MSQVQQATGAYAQKPLLTAIRNTSSSRLPYIQASRLPTRDDTPLCTLTIVSVLHFGDS